MSLAVVSWLSVCCSAFFCTDAVWMCVSHRCLHKWCKSVSLSCSTITYLPAVGLTSVQLSLVVVQSSSTNKSPSKWYWRLVPVSPSMMKSIPSPTPTTSYRSYPKPDIHHLSCLSVHAPKAPSCIVQITPSPPPHSLESDSLTCLSCWAYVTLWVGSSVWESKYSLLLPLIL